MLPLTGPGLDRWILQQRPPRNRLDPWRPYAYLAEPEVGPDGETVEAVTIFLTNRECPFRCVMCDLWRNTLEETVPPGAIAGQIRYALERLPVAPGTRRHLKLYNAGSFFDPHAIPPAEYPAIARLAAPLERVVVECHPGFINKRCLAFRDMLRAAKASLEIAVGLETAHPKVLSRLNKRMTLEQFHRAAEFLVSEAIDLRVFILVRPPWLSEAAGAEWAKRSIAFAFDCGASVCSLIPTRGGNGAMEALAATGEFEPPRLSSVEAAMEFGLALRRGRVFADLWDIRRFASCPACSDARIARLEMMNRAQIVPPSIACVECSA